MIQPLVSSPLRFPPTDLEKRRMVLNLARNVARARQEAGFTQHQLATAADLSRATIHLIEAGACDPRLSTVTSLARALGQTALKLFDDHAPAFSRANA